MNKVKNVVTEAISILLRAIMRTTMRNYTYDTRLGVFISVIDRNNFHIIQTSTFLDLDTPKEQDLRLANMKVSMKHVFLTWKSILWKNLCFERFCGCDNRCFLSFIRKEINDGVHKTPELDPKMESNATNEVDSILKTLCLEPYIPNFKEQVCIYHKSQIRF